MRVQAKGSYHKSGAGAPVHSSHENQPGTHIPLEKSHGTEQKNLAVACCLRQVEKTQLKKVASSPSRTEQHLLRVCSRCPLTVRRILIPPTIRKILYAVRVERIEHAVHLRPIRVKSVKEAVTVKRVEEPIPIRPLQPVQDGLTIYGSNPNLPVQTDTLGRLVFSGQVQISPVTYTEQAFIDQLFQEHKESLPAQDVSLQTNLSYAVVNRSEKAVTIFLEISPNGNDFLTDTQVVVQGNTLQAVTPLRFLRYTRISYQSYTPGTSGVMDVYYQAQSG